MKISAALASLMAIVFASICFGVAIKGWVSLSEITDPVQIEDAKGFAGFWAFLGSVAVVCGALSWWIISTGKENE